nr:hypothetical protein [Hymenobacter cellulosilyticus]
MVLLVPIFKGLSGLQIGGQPLGIIGSAAIIGVVSLLVAFWAVSTLPESYGKDLDYLEE